MSYLALVKHPQVTFPDPTPRILQQVGQKLRPDPARLVVSYLVKPRQVIFLEPIGVFNKTKCNDRGRLVRNFVWRFDKAAMEQFDLSFKIAMACAHIGIVILEEHRVGFTLEQYRAFFKKYAFSKSIFAITTDKHTCEKWVRAHSQLTISDYFIVKPDVPKELFTVAIQDQPDKKVFSEKDRKHFEKFLNVALYINQLVNKLH